MENIVSTYYVSEKIGANRQNSCVKLSIKGFKKLIGLIDSEVVRGVYLLAPTG